MRLKTTPEDFVVKELLHYNMDPSGEHSLYLLKKRLWNTEDCLQWLSRALNIPRKRVGYCGNKDKHALTEQYITLWHGPKDVRTPEGFSLEYLGRVQEQLRLGNHESNSFIITVRDYDGQLPVLKPVKNYFGEQRFGGNNTEMGFALLNKDYRSAAELLNLEFITDPINALRKINKHTLLLYIHAAQSALWNEFVRELPSEHDDVPMPGFSPAGNAKYLPLLDKFLESKGLSRESFINRSFQELSLEGGSRRLLQDVRDFSANSENRVCTLCFSLSKGQYATETVKQLLD